MKNIVYIILGSYMLMCTALFAQPREVRVHFIKDMNDAKKVCPDACHGIVKLWNGTFRTLTVNQFSACACEFSINVNAGYLQDQAAAEQRCGGICKTYDGAGKWSGNWAKSVPSSGPKQ